uniref:Uncharacterized protein n=1 Tax=Sphaerodactylus townsendi TaxID=933632 RepID=A0ACB8F966_9SAUR
MDRRLSRLKDEVAEGESGGSSKDRLRIVTSEEEDSTRNPPTSEPSAVVIVSSAAPGSSSSSQYSFRKLEGGCHLANAA